MPTTKKTFSYPLKYYFLTYVFALKNYRIILKLMAKQISIFVVLKQLK